MTSHNFHNPNSENIIQKNDILSEVEKNENIKEIYDKLVQKILKKYIWKILSTEWVPLNKEVIYDDVINILESLDTSLNQNNIFSKKIKHIINNFLKPKEKWIKYIEISINIFLWKHENNIEKKIDTSFEILKSSLWTLIDLSRDSSEEEIQSYINEIKNISKLKKIFKIIPDLEKILTELIPSIIKWLDKDKLISQINTFYTNHKEDIINLYNKPKNLSESDVDKFNNINLHLLNWAWKILDSIINEDTVDSFVKSAVKLNIITKNNILRKLFFLLASNDISKKNKVLLAKQATKLIDIITTKWSTEKDLDNFGNQFLELIAKIRVNIDSRELSELITEILWESDDKNNIDLNYKEVSELLWENKMKIPWIMLRSFVWFINTKEDLINYLIESDTLEENLKLAWWKLIERIKSLTKSDLEWIIEEMRNEINKNLNSTSSNEAIDNKDNKKETTQSRNIIDKLLKYLEQDIKKIVSEKLKKSEPLNKSELINIIINDLIFFLEVNINLLLEHIAKQWIKIKWEKQKTYIIHLIRDILKHPKSIKTIESIINWIWKEVKNSKDIVNSFSNILKEVLSSQWESLISDEVRSEWFELWIDLFYTSLTKDKEKVIILLNIISQSTWTEIAYKKETLSKLVFILRENISAKSLIKLIKKYPSIKNLDFNNINLNNLYLDLYNEVDDKIWFINSLKEVWIINEVKTSTDESIEEADISLWIDIIYSTLEDTEKGEVWSLIDTFNEYFPSELKEINILWKSLWYNLEIILRSISKNNLKDILHKYLSWINKLDNKNITEKEKTILILNISQDILSELDITIFQKQLLENAKTPFEKTYVNILDEIREISNEHRYMLSNSIIKWIDLYNFYESWYEVKKWSKTEKEIKTYSENLFLLINKLVIKLDKSFISNNFKSYKSESNNNDVLIEIINKCFIWNNRLFITKELFVSIFKEGNLWESIHSYFSNKENKSNFWNTVADFFINCWKVNK